MSTFCYHLKVAPVFPCFWLLQLVLLAFLNCTFLRFLAANIKWLDLQHYTPKWGNDICFCSTAPCFTTFLSSIFSYLLTFPLDLAIFKEWGLWAIKRLADILWDNFELSTQTNLFISSKRFILMWSQAAVYRHELPFNHQDSLDVYFEIQSRLGEVYRIVIISALIACNWLFIYHCFGLRNSPSGPCRLVHRLTFLSRYGTPLTLQRSVFKVLCKLIDWCAELWHDFCRISNYHVIPAALYSIAVGDYEHANLCVLFRTYTWFIFYSCELWCRWRQWCVGLLTLNDLAFTYGEG